MFSQWLSRPQLGEKRTVPGTKAAASPPNCDELTTPNHRVKTGRRRGCRQSLASPHAVVTQSLLKEKRRRQPAYLAAAPDSQPCRLGPLKSCEIGIRSPALNNLASRLLEDEVGVQNQGFTLAVTVLQGNTCTGSGLTGAGGYTPEPSEQDQLMEIDSKIQQLSVKEFVPSQGSSPNLSLSQVPVRSAT